MNSLTVNLHLLMVSFYRPSGARTQIVVEDTTFPSDSYAVRSQAAFHGLDPDDTVVRLRPRDDVIASTVASSTLERARRLRGARAARRRQLPHRRAARHPGDHRRRPGRRGHRRLGSRPRRRQRAAGAARLGRRLRRLVLVQVPQRRPGSGRGGVRPRAPSRCRRHAALRGLVEHRCGDAVRDGGGGSATGQRRRVAGVQPADPGDEPAAHVAGAVRQGRDDGACASAASGSPATSRRCSTPSRRSEIVTPRDPNGRGAQLSLRVGDRAGEIANRLRHEHGVVVDTRQPDIVRLAPVPLYSTYHDCWRAASALAHDPRGRLVSAHYHDEIAVVGAGLAGCLLACFLARRGCRVRVYERRPDPAPRARPSEDARSTWRSPNAVSTLSAASTWPTRSWPTPCRCAGGWSIPCDGPLDFQPYSASTAIGPSTRSAGLRSTTPCSTPPRPGPGVGPGIEADVRPSARRARPVAARRR